MNVKYTVPKKQWKNKPMAAKGFVYTEFPTVGLVARTESGKTVCIYNMLRKLVRADTKGVCLIVSTFDKDETWGRTIKGFLDRIKVPYEIHSGINDDVTKVNAIREYMDKMDDGGDASEPAGPTEPPDPATDVSIRKQCVNWGAPEGTTEAKRKPRVKTYDDMVPDYVVVCDDCSSECQDTAVANFAAKNRHYRCAFLVSVQESTDMSPKTWKQLDQAIIFRGMNARLPKIFKVVGMGGGIDYPMFSTAYKIATSVPFGFINIDIPRGGLYSKFNHKFDPKKLKRIVRLGEKIPKVESAMEKIDKKVKRTQWDENKYAELAKQLQELRSERKAAIQSEIKMISSKKN